MYQENERPLLPLPEKVLADIPTLASSRHSYRCPACSGSMFSYNLSHWLSVQSNGGWIDFKDRATAKDRLIGDLSKVFPPDRLRIVVKHCQNCQLSIGFLYSGKPCFKSILCRFDPQEMWDLADACDSDDCPF